MMPTYDMDLYRSKREEVREFSDQQIIFKALAVILSSDTTNAISFEYHRALIDDLIRRSEEAQVKPTSNARFDIIGLLRDSTEWGELGPAMADVLEMIRNKKSTDPTSKNPTTC